MDELIETDRVEQLLLYRVEDEDGRIDGAVSGEQENIRGHSDAWQVTTGREEVNLVEQRIGLSDASRVLLSQEHELVSQRSQASHSAPNNRDYLVKRSSRLSTDVSGDRLAKMFPHLFPYGRGHPGEKRRISVSLRDCVKHYTMLSGCRFTRDELFTLVSVESISMRNMYVQNSLRCQRFPILYNGYESIGAEELGKSLLENGRCLQGQRSHRTLPGSVALKFLRTVEVSSAAVWGSNSERAKCRQKAFAYEMGFGQPSLFVTLTTNTDNSQVTAHYAGISSVETLFDILEVRMPSKAELREVSLGDDCPSARLFMRNVDTLIEHILVMDPATKKQTLQNGLFGTVAAYFGMVETQGRGTLHIHLLIWLEHAPSSSAELEENLDGADGAAFRESVAAYVRSVVSTDLPLPIEKGSCVNCGASYSNLVGLNIPARARQNPRRGLYSASAHAEIVELALVQCGACKTKFSSQQILRSVLLQNRPLH